MPFVRIGTNWEIMRADVQGNTVPIWKTNWDVIFTCDPYTKSLAETDRLIIIKRYDGIKWNCGSMVVAFRK